jgi:penicillin-binding protein 1A
LFAESSSACILSAFEQFPPDVRANLLMSRRERQRYRRHNRGHPVRRVVGITVLVTVCGLALGGLFGAAWVVSVADSAPSLSDLKAYQPHPLTQIYTANGRLLGYVHSDTLYKHVAGNRIPALMKDATVAIEDRRFWHHGALDYQGIIRAALRDVFNRNGALQGASTLTMQLVKIKYLDGTRYAKQRNLKYKIIQAKLADELAKHHSKMWILDSYLDSAPYGTVGGESAVGVGGASLVFFDKPVWKLDLAQMALLAGLPQSPTDYNPYLYPHQALARRNQVLGAMASSHYITPEAAYAAQQEPLQLHPDQAFARHIQPYLFDYVQQQLIKRFGLNTVQNGGLKVYTTIDLHAQEQAQAAIMAHNPGGSNLDAQPAAALASIDPHNGHIVALAQSATYPQTQVFYPVQAHRQPGSSFKVFALMTLIHDYNGDPNQTYYTSKFLPTGWLSIDPTWSVHTAELSYLGTINVTRATTESDNTVFAQLAADLGYDKLDATAHAMGITSPLDGNPSEVIGGLRVGVTPLEMADAYATLANGGSHVAPTILTKVVFPDGSVVNLGNPKHHRVFSEGESYAATQVLKTVITSGTGTAANYGCPAAGKTGTAENEDNAWFVGYTPKYSTAVWVGYPQGNIGMGGYGFGGVAAAPIWHDFMLSASNGYCSDFPQPSSYWTGTAFVGPHSAAGAPLGPSTTTSSGGTSVAPTTTTSTGGHGHNNRSLFAHPPQPQPAPAGGGPGPTSGSNPSGGAGPPSGGGGPGPGNGHHGKH